MPKADYRRSVLKILNEAAEIIRKAGEIHYSQLAFMINRSPQWVCMQRRVLVGLFDDIDYTDGYFFVKKPSESKEEKGESNEEGSD